MLMTRTPNDDKIATLRQMLRSRGLDPRDFEIEEDDRSGISQLLGLVGGILTLRRRSTGEIRVYASGPGSAWFATIVADLDRGYFGAPTPTGGFQRRLESAASALWI
jgi:hypothetical protein